ncbi:hypothetical protein BD410DRAFT_889928 [Rickenella mellea]|uniref:Uncharacterized protein n=1 Tax=Rickenella mellea TaxID=50990 RepID=A0A4Y7PLW4_9AGAM|nr:hypothetical protein BD410DRAFT_889928 [Rickenella mellea]
MGTRGLYAYRHHKIYYIKYNGSDSYPRGLGAELVDKITADAEDFTEWLRSKRAFFDKEEDRLKNPEAGVDRFDGYFQFPSSSPPRKRIDIDWTYTIDLDDNAFIIDMEIYFPLNNIPRDEYRCHWINCIGNDAYGDRCLCIAIPREFAAIPSRPAPEPSTHGLVAYGNIESNLKLLPPSEWLSQELSLDATAELVKLHYYWFYLSQTFETNSANFKMLALGLLPWPPKVLRAFQAKNMILRVNTSSSWISPHGWRITIGVPATLARGFG